MNPIIFFQDTLKQVRSHTAFMKHADLDCLDANLISKILIWRSVNEIQKEKLGDKNILLEKKDEQKEVFEIIKNAYKSGILSDVDVESLTESEPYKEYLEGILLLTKNYS